MTFNLLYGSPRIASKLNQLDKGEISSVKGEEFTKHLKKIHNLVLVRVLMNSSPPHFKLILASIFGHALKNLMLSLITLTTSLQPLQAEAPLVHMPRKPQE